MKPQLLIFDLDGTLIDSRGDLTAGINYVRSQYGLGPLSVETVGGYIGDGMRRLVERSLQGADVDFETALETYKAYYDKHLTEYTTLYDGVAEGLARLVSAGHQLALLTNKPGDSSREIMKYFGLDGCFGTLLGGGDFEPLKPDPGGLLQCMESAGMDASCTWMIGDHCTDLAAAQNAGVQSAFVRYGFGEERGYKATVYFASFPELVGYFV